MRRAGTMLLLLVVLAPAGAGCRSSAPAGETPLRDVASPEELDRLAVFSLAVMSDNKGDGPQADARFARMVRWIADAGDRFVIGLGDHVCASRANEFPGFIRADPWWRTHFYPNVADGENEFYGRDQGDWGAGGKIIAAAGLPGRKGVRIRDNGAEYTAAIKADGYRVHLVQLHYPDTGSAPFRDDSKRYLADTVGAIEKGPKDIIIAAAHSRWGFWIDELSPEQRKVVMSKCDLLLSATTHVFMRKTVAAHGDGGPLIINTGSVTFPRGGCPGGYVQVHVVERPLRLVVQYVDLMRPKRELARGKYALVKVIGGKSGPATFAAPPSDAGTAEPAK